MTPGVGGRGHGYGRACLPRYWSDLCTRVDWARTSADVRRAHHHRGWLSVTNAGAHRTREVARTYLVKPEVVPQTGSYEVTVSRRCASVML